MDGDDADGCADLYAPDAVFELDGTVAGQRKIWRQSLGSWELSRPEAAGW